MSGSADRDRSAARAIRLERNWATVCVVIIVALILVSTYAGIHQATMPQTAVETIDPTRLHLSGEFTEANLGSELRPDGTVLVRAIGQQYSFTPSCIMVPADTAVRFRMTSADAVHGFLIDHTTVNTMLIPGYVSTIDARFPETGQRHMPCHEFCGNGHEGMWAQVKIIDKARFQQLATNRRRLDCVE